MGGCVCQKNTSDHTFDVNKIDDEEDNTNNNINNIEPPSMDTKDLVDNKNNFNGKSPEKTKTKTGKILSKNNTIL